MSGSTDTTNPERTRRLNALETKKREIQARMSEVQGLASLSIPKPKKHKAGAQKTFVFDEGKGLSTKEQQYDPTFTLLRPRRSTKWRDARHWNSSKTSRRPAVAFTVHAARAGGSGCWRG